MVAPHNSREATDSARPPTSGASAGMLISRETGGPTEPSGRFSLADDIAQAPAVAA